MGCDIHMYLEIRDTKEKWVFMKKYNLERWYSMFALFNGHVRNDRSGIKSVTKTRSLPQGLSNGIRQEFYKGMGDWHSESYFDWDDWIHFKFLKQDIHGEEYDFEDMMAKETMYNQRYPTYMYRDLIKDLKGAAHAYGKKNARLVFWFDN